MQKYINSESVFNTRKNADKTQMFEKFHSDIIKGTKNASFLFCDLQLITVLLLICDSYMS